MAMYLLDNGNIEVLVAVIRSLVAHCPAIDDKLETEAEYFKRNAEKMRYPKFRARACLSGPA